MSSSTTQPAFTDTFTAGTGKSTKDIPIHASLNTDTNTNANQSNHTSAQKQSATYTPISPGSASIPDGRRNSQGENLASPTEGWKPNFQRVQSWNREEFKRGVYKSEMVEEPGQGTGFTEGGKGTRKV